MQTQMYLLFALLLVARVAVAEQPHEASNVQPEPVPVAVSQPEQSPPVAGPQPVVPVVQGTHQHGGQSYPGDQHTHAHSPMHYAPAGMIQVVNGAESGAHAKPVAVRQLSYAAAGGPVPANGAAVGSAEQYGQPESASIPANYKPFGSWGLYIGGNPADGYYSNYYKALGNSVDKQVGGVAQVESAAGVQAKPSPVGSAGVAQASAFGPMLRQAGYPYGSNYQDQVYTYDYYTPADLNSGSRVSVAESPVPSVYSSGSLVYADSYATKRLGQSGQVSQVAQKPEVQSPAKGYQRFGYAAYGPSGQVYSHPAQVVAYPVPVGSQIVGSQPGVEGAFQPYGVHGYTRYAIKPTVVASDQSSYYHSGVHSSPMSHFPVYKQQPQHSVQPHQVQPQHHQAHQAHHPQPVLNGQHQLAPVYQPLSFYGYPLSQLHYSQGSIAPAFGHQVGNSGYQPAPVGESPVAHSPVEAASSEKSESEIEKATGAQVKPMVQKSA